MVTKWEVTIPKLSGSKTRNVYLYLPEDYEKDELRRYPVLYMFDGHNVFYDAESAFGKSWNLTSYLLWTRKQMIVVAVECNKHGNNRLKEYSPTTFSDAKYGNIRGRGRAYMEWLVKELKPYIDEYNRNAVSYKKIGVLKVRTEEFPKNTLRKIMRFKLDMSID